jgi:hypothetical protein
MGMNPNESKFATENEIVKVPEPNTPTTSLDPAEVDKILKAAHKKALEEIQAAQVETGRQIQASQITAITIIGIFASIISLLMIEFQLLKTLNKVSQILGYTLIIFVLLLGFNLSLDYLAKSTIYKEHYKFPRGFTIFAITTFLIGLACFCPAISQMINS